MDQPLTESRLRKLSLELEDRIRSGERSVSEQLFTEHPHLLDDTEAAIEVIYREDLTLEQLGERPDNEALFARFPKWEDRLRKLLDVHDAMADEEILDSTTPPGTVAAIGQMIDKYKLLQEIGEGGFGVVYMAEQVQPVRRKVALKVIKPGMDTRDALARFESERQALALMDHPNIAHVLDAGATDSGHPFFVMELVRGVPITEFCEKQNVSVPDRLKLFRVVCQAVQHAHSKGIIHRDLKPSNVMITLHDTVPVPKIIDFGISKALNQQLTEKTLFTRYGQMLGTPMYMSPEQAEMSGLGIDIRSDVYSLGVMLYELLTGTPPFSAERLKTAAYAEMIQIISEEDPPTPSTRIVSIGKTSDNVLDQPKVDYRSLSVQVRGDLDQIVMKALEKDRARRYETVNDLARDVERYMNDEPVLAGTPSMTYRSQKFLRRNKALVRSVAAVIAALLFGLVLSLIGFANAYRASQRAEVARVDEQRQRMRAETEERKSRQALLNEQAHLERVDTNLYYQQIARIHREWLSNNLDNANRILGECSEKRRGWEWQYLKQVVRPKVKLFEGHTDKVVDVAFSPDGTKLASCSSEWNNKSKLGEIILWDLESCQPIHKFGPFPGGAMKVRFAKDGKRLISVSGNGKGMSVWDTVSGTLDYATDSDQRIYGVACSPDNQMVALAGADGDIRLRQMKSGALIRTIPGKRSQYSVDFSPDGKQLVSVSGAGIARLWDVSTGELVFQTTGHGGNRFGRFSPDGKLLATCGYDQSWHGLIKLYRFESNRLVEVASHISSFDVVTKIEFSPDNQMLALNGLDGPIRFWEPLSGREYMSIPAHNGYVGHVQFGPGGRRVASCGEDGIVKVWDLVVQEKGIYSRQDRAFVRDFDLHPDGNRVALAGGFNQSFTNLGNKSVEILKYNAGIGSHELSTTFESAKQWIGSVDFSPNGEMLVGAGRKGHLTIWDDRTGKVSKTMEVKESALQAVQFGFDNKWLACDGEEFEINVWDVDSAKLRKRLNGHVARINDVVCHPRLPIVASASDDRSIKIWDVNQEEEVQSLRLHKAEVTKLAFSNDGMMMASADSSGTVMVWQKKSNSKIDFDHAATLRGHGASVSGLGFSPDGHRLASIGKDKTVAIWDVENQQEAIRLSLNIPNHHVYSVMFNPDGKHLLASCGRHLQVWDAGGHAIEDSATIDVQGEDLVAWHHNVARSCIQDRNWYGAKFHWDRLISLEPDKLNYWSGRANANAQLGKLDSAIQDYQTAFELDGERFGFLIRTSLLQLALGEIGNHKKTKKQLLGSFADDVPESGKNQLA